MNSGLKFDDSQIELKTRHNVINITVFLAIIGLLFGIAVTLISGAAATGIILNLSAIVILLATAVALRLFKKRFDLITTIFASEFLILFNLLLFVAEPSQLKHVWLLTYPALIFFYKGKNAWIPWIGYLVLSLFISKLQPFIPMDYSLRDIVYLSVVLTIMTIVIYIYKHQIDLGNETIRSQKEQLETLTKELESKVQEKTKELQRLNASLEQKVDDKAKELVEKDAMILAQSRQAAMGEMISMIAHQWRQPLSTITLQISNLKINALLGKQSIDETNTALEHISNTIIYLSDTIDDFQSFFKPNKKQERKNICELVERGTSFAKPRLKLADINLINTCSEDIYILTYPNEFAQVIINIINNAIDALLERAIEQPIISVSIIHNNHTIEISISDNAGGIAPEIINNIFEPYFSTKGKNGTGLGLYMSKMIVEKELGGILQVKNNHDGAEFTIKIPYANR